jgi:hypothetical protein
MYNHVYSSIYVQAYTWQYIRFYTLLIHRRIYLILAVKFFFCFMSLKK